MQQQARRFTDTHLRGGDRLVRYSAVYGAYAGSIPVRRATSFVPVPAGPTKVSGFKLNWRSTRLLTERTGFDSLGAHQVVPG